MMENFSQDEMEVKASTGTVAVLEARVVEQIAAGEVIERPASAVKELLENALDAGATRVDVEVEQGGRALIRVADNGCGMTRCEAEISVCRHATSKIRGIDDLMDIRTLGFRGEGLSSVAAASRLTLTTRRSQDHEGTELNVAGAGSVEVRPVGCRPGTAVVARDLFFNTPARLKFLKSTTTEGAHINDVVTRVAFAHHPVHFTLKQDGRLTLDLPQCADLVERARQLLGRRAGRLLTAGAEDSHACVVPCLAGPESALSTARSLTVLVNRRAVRDRTLLHAVTGAFAAQLPQGRYPVGVVHLQVNPEAVDVNVHPQKLEVRFADTAAIHRLVKRAAVSALEREPVAGQPQVTAERVYQLRAEQGTTGTIVSQRSGAEHDEQAQLAEATRRFWSAQGGNAAAEESVDYALGTALRRWEDRCAEAGQASNVGKQPIRLLARTFDRLLICESNERLLLVDRLAAWATVIRRSLDDAFRAEGVAATALQQAVYLRLDAASSQVLAKHQALAHRLGFDTEPFGGSGWILRGLPQILCDAAARAIDEHQRQRLAAVGESLLVGLIEQLEGMGARADAEIAAQAALRHLAAAVARARCDSVADEQLLAALEQLADHHWFEPVSLSAAVGGSASPLVGIRLDRAQLLRRGTPSEVEPGS